MVPVRKDQDGQLKPEAAVYRVTGERSYLELCQGLIDRRGQATGQSHADPQEPTHGPYPLVPFRPTLRYLP